MGNVTDKGTEGRKAGFDASFGTGARAVGETEDGGWVTYNTPEAAFADIGFDIEFPASAYGRIPTDFLVVSRQNRKYLSVEYWDDPRSADSFFNISFFPIAIVQKELGGMPSGSMTDTNLNRHHIESNGHVVTVCLNDSVTVARWQFTDTDSGQTWHYYASVMRSLSDEELLEFIRQFDAELVWSHPKSSM